MQPLEHYQKLLEQNIIDADDSQQSAIEMLQALYQQLELAQIHSRSLTVKLINLIHGRQYQPVKGLYFWGDVGRGKTMLMNLFFDSLPFENKIRLHFHHFMLDVHEQLSKLQQQKNPLQYIAKTLAAKYRVICLDEFIVTNITDAMLLYGLLDELFKQGVTLIATSNRIPDDLYLNGLQRERFLPAIALIKKHTDVMHLESETDHRLKLLEHSDVYYCPANEEADMQMKHRFDAMAIEHIKLGTIITILDRPIPTIALAEEIAWFDFNVLCEAPRAAQDYIELAEDYHTLFLSNVPVMNEYLDDKARRFIYLIDELYDKSVKLILSAQLEPNALYTGSMLKFAFQRTTSRLIEMRSITYLEQPHKNA